MKQIKFIENDEKNYDIRIYYSDNKNDYLKYGELVFDDDQDAWVCWTGQGYSDKDTAWGNESDEGFTYEKDLGLTKQIIINELEDI